jgi:hypothetical protein
MENFNLKKFLSEKSLLNESAPGYDTRKTGEALPTLESVKAAYEAKEGKDKLPDSIAAAEKTQIEKDARKSRGDIKEEASKAKELSDRVLTIAKEGIMDLNGTELMEFRALIAQAFDMKDEA